MATNIQGSLILLAVREAGGSDDEWRRVTCSIDDQLELDNEITETDTKCGTFTGIKEVKATVSGNATVNASPTSSEFSWKDVALWQKNKTLLDWKYYNAADDTTAEGEAVYAEGQGNFTNSVNQGTNGETSQFSWTLSPQGEIHLEPQS